jgi:hypothetical protein
MIVLRGDHVLAQRRLRHRVHLIVVSAVCERRS